MNFNFQDKVVLVTGAGAGLGLAIATAFAKAKAQVVITDISQVSIDEAVASIRSEGGAIEGILGDVTDSKSVNHIVDNIVSRYGRLDIGVNNAGTSTPLKDFHELAESDFDRVMDINVKGVWLCMQAEIRQLLTQGGGVIVNMASACSKNTYEGATPYVTSKFAVAGLTRNVAVEYANRGIRINAICPGNVETPLVHSMVDDLSVLYSRHAIKRMCQLDEVTNGVMFLASDLSSFSTGTLLEADGGWSAI